MLNFKIYNDSRNILPLLINNIQSLYKASTTVYNAAEHLTQLLNHRIECQMFSTPLGL